MALDEAIDAGHGAVAPAAHRAVFTTTVQCVGNALGDRKGDEDQGAPHKDRHQSTHGVGCHAASFAGHHHLPYVLDRIVREQQSAQQAVAAHSSGQGEQEAGHHKGSISDAGTLRAVGSQRVHVDEEACKVEYGKQWFYIGGREKDASGGKDMQRGSEQRQQPRPFVSGTKTTVMVVVVGAKNSAGQGIQQQDRNVMADVGEYDAGQRQALGVGGAIARGGEDGQQARKWIAKGPLLLVHIATTGTGEEIEHIPPHELGHGAGDGDIGQQSRRGVVARARADKDDGQEQQLPLDKPER